MSDDTMSDTVKDLPQKAPAPAGPPTASVQVDLGARTHVGKVRSNNEDNFHVVQFGRYLRTLLTSVSDDQIRGATEETGYGYAVADGMGGRSAGEIASRLAITLLVEHALSTPDWMLGREDPHATEILNRAAKRFRDVNEAVIEQAETKSGLKGMGTTLSLAMSLGNDLFVAHVGDSPIFLFRGDGLHRLTRDHTMGQQLAELGVPDAARLRHVLTHAIGIGPTGGEPDVHRYRLDDGDRLMLCTDGLTDMVDYNTIARELSRKVPADDVCRRLIQLALDGGAKDNVTIVVAGYRIPK